MLTQLFKAAAISILYAACLCASLAMSCTFVLDGIYVINYLESTLCAVIIKESAVGCEQGVKCDHRGLYRF